MKYILIVISIVFLSLNVKSQLINWVTETGLSNGDTFVDGQVITNFAGSGLDARINVVVSGTFPRISGGTRVIIGDSPNSSFTLTFLNGDRADVLLNNHQNLQRGENITVSNPNGQRIRLKQTSNNGGGLMTIDGVTVSALNATVVNDDVAVVTEVNNGAGTSWETEMSWVSSFTWAYANGPGTSATEGFQLTISNPSPLPVSFNSMNVSSEDKKNVLVDWETASEINNDYFIVERSLNSSDWNEVGKIGGSGNSNEVIKYSLEDKNPIIGNTLYYRVKQVDFDGKSSYGKMESIRIDKESLNVLVYPNPVINDKLIIEVIDNVEIESYELFDNSGRVVTHLVEKTLNASSIILDVKKLKKGIYFLKLNKTINKIIKE